MNFYYIQIDENIDNYHKNSILDYINSINTQSIFLHPESEKKN